MLAILFRWHVQSHGHDIVLLWRSHGSGHGDHHPPSTIFFILINDNAWLRWLAVAIFVRAHTLFLEDYPHLQKYKWMSRHCHRHHHYHHHHHCRHRRHRHYHLLCQDVGGSVSAGQRHYWGSDGPPEMAHTWLQASSPAATLSLSMRCTHNVWLIVISISSSIFNNIDLLCSMSADCCCCMPPHREWGIMVALGWRRPSWLARAFTLPSFI